MKNQIYNYFKVTHKEWVDSTQSHLALHHLFASHAFMNVDLSLCTICPRKQEGTGGWGKCLSASQVRSAQRITFPKSKTLGMSFRCSPRWKSKQYFDSLQELFPFSFSADTWAITDWYLRCFIGGLPQPQGKETAEFRTTHTHCGCQSGNSRKLRPVAPQRALDEQ